MSLPICHPFLSCHKQVPYLTHQLALTNPTQNCGFCQSLPSSELALLAPNLPWGKWGVKWLQSPGTFVYRIPQPTLSTLGMGGHPVCDCSSLEGGHNVQMVEVDPA